MSPRHLRPLAVPKEQPYPNTSLVSLPMPKQPPRPPKGLPWSIQNLGVGDARCWSTLVPQHLGSRKREGRSQGLPSLSSSRCEFADYIPAASTPTMRNTLVYLPFTFSCHGLMTSVLSLSWVALSGYWKIK
jgi:hypothetical protein